MKSERQEKTGLGLLFKRMFHQRKEKKFPQVDNPESIQSGSTSRREMIKNLAVIPVLGVPFFGIAKKTGWSSFAEGNLERLNASTSPSTENTKAFDTSTLQGNVPTGKIKNVEISRLIPGGNLVSGFVYSRDLLYVSALMKKYFTDEKVMEILELAETCGINTTILRADEHILRILKEYWRRGGKIKWIAQTYPKDNDFSNIKMAIDNGAIGAFVQGGI